MRRRPQSARASAQAKDSKRGGRCTSSDLVLEVRGLPPRRAQGRKVRRGRVFGRDAVAVVRRQRRREMEKVRIGMTASTFFICREVEVRIRSE